MKTRIVATYQQAIALLKLYGGKITAYQTHDANGYLTTRYEVKFYR